MDYVRDHLDGDLTLRTLAGVANFSPFHFHRIFGAVAGETLAAFVRRARLERAAYLMKASPNRTLTSIALGLGFNSVADFSRAFSREYGSPPSAWDRRSRLDSQVIAESLANHRNANPVQIPLETVRIVEHDSCRVAYVRMQTYFIGAEMQTGYSALTEWLERRDVDWRAANMIGMSWDHYELTPLDQIHYDLGFTVPQHVEGDNDIGTYDLPALRAAEVHCQGDLKRISEAWDFLYDQWLPGSSYEPDDLPATKRFRRRPDEIGWDKWDLDCSIAIRRATP